MARIRGPFLLVLILLPCFAFGDYDSLRYTKSSQYSVLYSEAQITVTVNFNASIPVGTYNILCTSGSTQATTYVPGCYNVRKPSAGAYTVTLPVQYWGAIAGSGANPYNSQISFQAASFQGTADAGQQAISGAATGGRMITGEELRDASVPSSFTNNGNTNAGPGQTNEVYNPVSITINLNGGVAPKSATFSAQGISNDGAAHTATLYYNGVAVQTFTIPAGPAGSNTNLQSLSYTTPFANTGDSYAWKFDNLPGASGAINVDGGNFTEAPPAVFSFMGSGPPTSTPAPTPNPTNGGVTTGTTGNTTSGPTPTPPPAGSTSGATNPVSNPPSVVNNNNTTISGTSTGATNEDIYADVYRALMDAGNNTQGLSLPTLTSFPTYTPPASTDGVPDIDASQAATDLQNQYQSMRDTMDNEKDSVDSLKTAAQGLIPTLPSVPAQNLHFTFPVPAVFGVPSFVVDASPYSDVISNFRLVCSVSLAVLLFVAFVRYCRSSLADLGR